MVNELDGGCRPTQPHVVGADCFVGKHTEDGRWFGVVLMIQLLKESWCEFSRAAIPPDAGVNQRSDLKLAYYHGAEAVMSIIEMVKLDKVTEDNAKEMLGQMKRESDDYWREQALLMKARREKMK